MVTYSSEVFGGWLVKTVSMSLANAHPLFYDQTPNCFLSTYRSGEIEKSSIETGLYRLIPFSFHYFACAFLSAWRQFPLEHKLSNEWAKSLWYLILSLFVSVRALTLAAYFCFFTSTAGICRYYQTTKKGLGCRKGGEG